MGRQGKKRTQLIRELMTLWFRLKKSEKVLSEQKTVLQLLSLIDDDRFYGKLGRIRDWTWNVTNADAFLRRWSEKKKLRPYWGLAVAPRGRFHRWYGMGGEVIFTDPDWNGTGEEELVAHLRGTWDEIVHPGDLKDVKDALGAVIVYPYRPMVTSCRIKGFGGLIIRRTKVRHSSDWTTITVTGSCIDCTPCREPFSKCGIKVLDPGVAALERLLRQQSNLLFKAQLMPCPTIDGRLAWDSPYTLYRGSPDRYTKVLPDNDHVHRFRNFVEERWWLIEVVYLVLHSHWNWGQHEALSADAAHKLFDTVHPPDAPVFVKDDSMRYTYVSPAFTRFFNISELGFLGRKDGDVFSSAGEWDLRHTMDVKDPYGQIIFRISSLVRPVDGDKRGWPILLISLAYISEGGLTRYIGAATRSSAELMDESRLPKNKHEPKAMETVMKLVRDAAKTNSIILLLGESGVGKDYLARHIHEHSGRAGGFFVINCAGIAPQLAESELFGHERGAFTGAQRRKRGLLELAEGGTLFLNEIGELSLPLQAKLLTFLDSKQFTRVGGEKNITVNARLIAATNRNLEEEVYSRRFRRDLFYRINAMTITVPPLRERREDIPTLAQEIIAQLCKDMQLPEVPTIDTASSNALKSYEWPGNVRELRNVLERALILNRGTRLVIPELGGQRDSNSPYGTALDEITSPAQMIHSPDSLWKIARPHGDMNRRPIDPGREILEALKQRYMIDSKWPIDKLAKTMKVDRSTLSKWLIKHGL